MSRRPGGSPPPSVPRRPSRVIRPAKTGGGGKKGCPFLLVWPLVLALGLTLVACTPRPQPVQVESPRPLQTGRQHAP